MYSKSLQGGASIIHQVAFLFGFHIILVILIIVTFLRIYDYSFLVRGELVKFSPLQLDSRRNIRLQVVL